MVELGDAFVTQSAPHIQRTICYDIEAAHHRAALAVAALPPLETAFLNACDGGWIRAARLPHLQLTNLEAITRMHRYLRQPLDCAKGITVGLDGKPFDQYGDNIIGNVYKAEGDNNHILLHHALRDTVQEIAHAAGLVCTVEQPGAVAGSERRPNDVGLPLNHGYKPAGTKGLWGDITVWSATAPSRVASAVRGRDELCAAASRSKRVKYARDIPDYIYFLPLPCTTEGRFGPVWSTLLHGFAAHWATRSNIIGPDIDLLHQHWWANKLAIVHARFTARCLLERCKACHRAVDAGHELPTPSLADLDTCMTSAGRA